MDEEKAVNIEITTNIKMNFFMTTSTDLALIVTFALMRYLVRILILSKPEKLSVRCEIFTAEMCDIHITLCQFVE